jgi:hypothetical protein
MNKIRITLTEEGDDIKGTINVEATTGFTLDALAATVEALADHYKVSVDDVMQDIYAIAKRRIKK